MLFGSYQFYCRLKSEAYLPPFKGSTFRGVFGRALKKVVCALKRQECTDCLLRERCVYTLVFETRLSKEPLAGARVVPPPHPFVIEPPGTTQTLFHTGSEFNFNLLLFGEANRAFPYFLYAFDQMGKIGIGRSINGRRGRFVLDSIRCGDEIVYNKDDQLLQAHDGVKTLQLEPSSGYSDDLKIKITVETPLRLKFENRLQAELPFHVLTRAMLRRVSSLLATYGDGEPVIDYKDLVSKAGAIRTASSDLSWYDWRRYSFRQESEMLMGGITGSVTYEGGLGAYLPFLEFCRQVHVGKQTSFGLGKFNAEIIS